MSYDSSTIVHPSDQGLPVPSTELFSESENEFETPHRYHHTRLPDLGRVPPPTPHREPKTLEARLSLVNRYCKHLSAAVKESFVHVPELHRADDMRPFMVSTSTDQLDHVENEETGFTYESLRSALTVLKQWTVQHFKNDKNDQEWKRTFVKDLETKTRLVVLYKGYQDVTLQTAVGNQSVVIDCLDILETIVQLLFTLHSAS